MSSKEAADYVGCKSVNGFYEWRKRRKIPTVDGGRKVAKADLDRALAARRPRKPVAVASLKNLKGAATIFGRSA